MKKLIYLITFLISISVVLAASTVDRSVASTATAGQTLTVTYNIVYDGTEKSLILTDQFPTGWTIVSNGDFGLSTDGKYLSLVEVSTSGLTKTAYSYTIKAGSTGTFKGYYQFQTGIKTNILDDIVIVGGIGEQCTQDCTDNNVCNANCIGACPSDPDCNGETICSVNSDCDFYQKCTDSECVINWVIIGIGAGVLLMVAMMFGGKKRR